MHFAQPRLVMDFASMQVQAEPIALSVVASLLVKAVRGRRATNVVPMFNVETMSRACVSAAVRWNVPISQLSVFVLVVPLSCVVLINHKYLKS